MTGQDGNIVLCGSNSYEKKYYFNEEFDSLPEAVKKQLHVMCVWFTEECGSILTMEFEPDGTLEFKHTISEYDGYYRPWNCTLRYSILVRNRKNEAEDWKCRAG